MEGVFDTSLAWILALQEAQSPAITSFFQAITFMGEEIFYLLFVPFLVWSIDFDKGARVGVALTHHMYPSPPLDPGGTIWRATWVGFIGLLAIYLGLQVPRMKLSSFFYVFRFLRYGVAGVWISYGAPWLFTHMNLSQTAPAQPGLQM